MKQNNLDERVSSKELASVCRVRKCSCCLNESVRYFCTFCEVNLCQKCKLRHLTRSAKTNKGHNVVYYRNKDSGIVHRRPCRVHENEPSTGFCETCNKSVCRKCKGHRKHKIVQISELLKGKIKEIRDSRKYLSNVLLPEIRKRLHYFQSCTATLELNHSIVKCKINQYATKLHNVVNQWTVEMLSRSAEEKRKSKNLIRRPLLETKKKHTEVKKRIEEKRNILRDNYALHNPELLPMNEAEDIECLFEKPDLKMPRISLSTSDFDLQFLRNFANITVTSSTSIIDKSNMLEVESKHFENKIQDMICCPNGDALFVTEEGKRKISKVDHDGNIQTEFKTKCEPLFTAQCPGGIIYGNPRDRTIEMNTSESPDKVRTVMSTGKWFPRGIVVTPSEKILVCLRSYEERRARVSVAKKNYLEFYEEIKSIELNERQPLYRDPRFIAENKNGDLCVTDSAKNSLIVVQKSGKLRFIYKENLPGHQFNPQNICTDKDGLLILLDLSPIFANIHVINHDGQYICHLASEYLSTPTAMCIDRYDRLWFANRENDKTKILCIQRSEDIMETLEEFKNPSVKEAEDMQRQTSRNQAVLQQSSCTIL